MQRGADRLPPRRFLRQAADLHLAPLGQQQGAGDRGRRHHQQVGALALAAQQQALLHAEAVLLVDHCQAEVLELDRLLEQRVGADHDRQPPVAELQQQVAPRRARHGAGEQPDGAGGQPFQRAEVLLGQHLRRRHQRGLRAGLHRAQHGQQRHQRLAGADVALQQPEHAARRGHVAVDLRQGCRLRRGGREAEAPQRLGPHLPGGAERAAGPPLLPRLHPGHRELVRQHLVVAEPGAKLRRRRFGRALQAEQGVAEGGPAFPPQQGRILPLRQVGHAAGGGAHGDPQLPHREPRRHRPDRVDGRDERLVLRRYGVGRVAHGQAAAERLHPAVHQVGCAVARPHQGGQAVLVPDRDLREGGAVGHPHAVGVAGLGWPVRARRFRPARSPLGRRVVSRSARAGAAVDEAVGQVEQQVAHPGAAGQPPQLLRRRRADAAQVRHGGEEGGQQIVHTRLITSGWDRGQGRGPAMRPCLSVRPSVDPLTLPSAAAICSRNDRA